MKLVITVNSDLNMNKTRALLEQSGLRIESVLDAIGIVTGTAKESAIPKLRALSGVLAVEPDTIVTLDPIEDPQRNR
jgi:hypothetical protein